MVAIAIDVEIALRYFGIPFVEVSLFFSQRVPTRGVAGLLDLKRNSLGSIVIESRDDGNGTIAARRLEVTEVVLLLAVLPLPFLPLIARVGLQVESVIEVVP